MQIIKKLIFNIDLKYLLNSEKFESVNRHTVDRGINWFSWGSLEGTNVGTTS